MHERIVQFGASIPIAQGRAGTEGSLGPSLLNGAEADGSSAVGGLVGSFAPSQHALVRDQLARQRGSRSCTSALSSMKDVCSMRAVALHALVCLLIRVNKRNLVRTKLGCQPFAWLAVWVSG